MVCPICDQKPMNCDCTPEEKRQYGEIGDLQDEIERLRLAPDEREAINAMACYFDTKGSIQMQAWGSLLRVILLRNDRIGSE